MGDRTNLVSLWSNYTFVQFAKWSQLKEVREGGKTEWSWKYVINMCNNLISIPVCIKKQAYMRSTYIYYQILFYKPSNIILFNRADFELQIASFLRSEYISTSQTTFQYFLSILTRSS